MVKVVDRCASVLEGALSRIEVYASDTVCADHDPSAQEDDCAPYCAACYDCLLIAETRCEARNPILDGALLADTMIEHGAALFKFDPGLAEA